MAARKSLNKKSRAEAAEAAQERRDAFTDEDEVRRESTLSLELKTLLALIFCVILFLSCFGVFGALGRMISNWFYGFFGIMGLFFPVLLFFLIRIYLNRCSRLNKARLTAGACMIYFSLCGIVSELVTGDNYTSFVEVYKKSVENHFYGGAFSSMLVHNLSASIGGFGAYLFFLLCFIIGIVLYTGLTFLNMLADTSYQASEAVKKRHRVAHERRRQERVSRQNYERRMRIYEEKQERQEESELRRERRRNVQGGMDFDITDLKKAAAREEAAKEREYYRQNPPSEEEIKRKYSDGVQLRQEIKQPAFMGGEAAADNTVTDNTASSAFTIHRADSEEDDSAVEKSGLSTEFNNSDTEDALQTESVDRDDALSQETDFTSPALDDLSQTETEDIPGTADDVASGIVPAAAKTKSAKLTAKEKFMQDQEIQSEIRKKNDQEKQKSKPYVLPPLRLLQKPESGRQSTSNAELRRTAKLLEDVCESFGVHVTVTNASCGPTVTRYELAPEQGVKVSRIVALADDIKLNLAVADVRIEAPIPGKKAVGIEVPNEKNSTVMLRELLETNQFKNFRSKLAFAVGKDLSGQPVIADIARMPHLLIAGATGSGKSVCINTLIMSILYKATPEEVKLILIDPKVVELSVYNDIPHLLIPVVTDPKKAAGALNWAVNEMMDRYKKFADINVRDMAGYNSRIDAIPDGTEGKPAKLPQIVVIVDELADLMMVASNEVEDAIVRLTQLARAAGIHLVIATQRPSVNVITGLIKANMPSRIAFAVSSGVDSRTILDMNGAEKLLGKGDMLFSPQGYPKPARIQGCFITDTEVADVVNFLKEKNEQAVYDDSVQTSLSGEGDLSVNGSPLGDRDILFVEAGNFIIEKEKASIGMLQRMFKIGFNRAARIMDQLCEAGVVSGEEGTKPRKILMTKDEFAAYLEEERSRS